MWRSNSDKTKNSLFNSKISISHHYFLIQYFYLLKIKRSPINTNSALKQSSAALVSSCLIDFSAQWIEILCFKGYCDKKRPPGEIVLQYVPKRFLGQSSVRADRGCNLWDISFVKSIDRVCLFSCELHCRFTSDLQFCWIKRPV